MSRCSEVYGREAQMERYRRSAAHAASRRAARASAKCAPRALRRRTSLRLAVKCSGGAWRVARASITRPSKPRPLSIIRPRCAATTSRLMAFRSAGRVPLTVLAVQSDCVSAIRTHVSIRHVA